MTLALALLGTALGQDASDRWKTIRTEHYRVFTPVAAEEWATHAAERLESMRARVVEEVGYDPKDTIDVIVRDPLSDSNGAAFPFLKSPRIEVWTTPPGPDSVLAGYRTWDEILFTHETAHIVHLTRPSRNPLIHALDPLAGIGPMTRKAPRWVIEGYATVVEGRLTGAGRPNSDGRATWLRHLATEGRLPSYWELDGNARWGGGSDAYLVGSAFLEWLDARRGPGSLRDLWAAMTARQNRTFDAAFQVVFGDSPSVLYGRFEAETTAAAMELEAERGPATGTTWLDASRGTGSPAVSPDGGRVAVPIVAAEGRRQLLGVYGTGEDLDAWKAATDATDRALARDPEDVRPARDVPYVKRDAVRKTWSRPANSARWLRDGSGIVLSAWAADGHGRWRPDLWLWSPDEKKERRLTRHDDVKDADPAPDGTWAVATQARWGATSIVRVDLANGAVTPLSSPSVTSTVAHPRVSPDGTKVLWVEDHAGSWGIAILDLADGSRRELALPAGASASDPAWTADGSGVLASLGIGGFVEIHQLGLDGSDSVLTRSAGGAYSPEPSPDGKELWWLAEDADGLDVKRSALLPVATLGASATALPVVRPAHPPTVTPPDVQAVTPKRLGLGHLEPRYLYAAALGPGSGETAIGLRVGDVVGRDELIAMAGVGNSVGPRGALGGLLGLRTSALPVVDVKVEGFVSTDVGTVVGGAATVEGDHAWSGGRLVIDGGGWMSRAISTETARPRDGVWTRAQLAWIEGSRGWFRLDLAARGEYARTGGDPWQRGEWSAQATIGRGPDLVVGYTLGLSRSNADNWSLGGTWSQILPEPMNWRALGGPWTPGAVVGPCHDRWVLATDLPIRAFVERDRVGGDPLPKAGSSAVGVSADLELDRQPFVKLPRATVTSGLACRVEDPVTGWTDRPCQDIDDYALWAAVRWKL
jgi:hypothetical protein